MPHQTDRLTWNSLIFHHAVVFLLLTHSHEGQCQGNGQSAELIGVLLGESITLPCQLNPATDAVNVMLEWARPDLDPRFVHVRRDGEDRLFDQHPSYKGRTSVSIDGLRRGDMSLKLSKVTFSDQGTYRCFVPGFKTDTSVKLVVDVFIKITNVSRGVLQCESTGWYLVPEVFWLNGEGNLLSAGPTETVRGPDDLYTVSSRVTVEKRHSNSFTCRVQQNSTNQTRETHIHVPDDFFEVQSSSSSTTVGLSVSLAVCILVILILGFFVWRHEKTKTKRSHRDETDEGEMNQESVVLMTKFNNKQAEVQQLQNEIKKMETDLQTLMEDLQSDTLEDIKKHIPSSKSSTSLYQHSQSVPVQSSSSLLKWPEMLRQKFQEKLQKKITELQEEHDRRDEAEKDVLKKNKELQDKTEQKQNSSLLSQNSTRKPAVVFKVDPHGKYIQLRNTSTEDQQLGGWVLKIQLNNEEPIKHTFEDSNNLKTEQVFTVGCRGYQMSYSPAQLVLEDLKSWRHTDTLQVSLISHPGEIQYNLDRITER